MNTRIQKWGNSLGLRIPKIMLESLNIRENDQVELIQTQDRIEIKKKTGTRHRRLEERLTQFYGRPIDEIVPLQQETELEWGTPEGTEIW